MLNCICRYKRRHGSSWRLHFSGSQRGYALRIRFPFKKERNSKIFTVPNLGFRVVTDSHKHYTQMTTLIQAFGPLILLLLSIFTFPRITDNSIHSFVTIITVAINVGNLAFHMAANRSYRTQTPMCFRIPFTCSVVNFQTVLEV